MTEGNAKVRVNLPTGDHQAMLNGEHRAMIVDWTATIEAVERVILKNYGMEQGKSLIDTVSTLCYANLSRVAWSLASVAGVKRGDFDPAEFGQICERIAREQIQRYRSVIDKAGGA